MARYREKHTGVEVEAVQWLGNYEPFDAASVGLKLNPGALERIDGGIELRLTEGKKVAAVGDFILMGKDRTIGIQDAATFDFAFEPVRPTDKENP